MKRKEDTWGWMLAADFFFAGMGGAMLLIAGLADLFLEGGQTSLLGNFSAPIFIGIGAGILILELGRPFQSWRVFLNPKAILTIGAWNMLMAIGCGLIFASFGLQTLPWSGWVVVRKIIALGCALFGLVVSAYPGVLLGRHKSRPFWTGPGMMVLFFASSLVTGSAAHLLSGLILPPASKQLIGTLPFLTAGILAFQLIVWIIYIWMKTTGTTAREAVAARHWISGKYSTGFWIGFLSAGTLLPIILFLLRGSVLIGLGSVLAILGGLLMRLMVIYSGDYRTWLPGEERYRSRLPLGDEEFLKAVPKKPA